MSSGHLSIGIGIDPASKRQFDEALAGIDFRGTPAGKVALQAAVSRTLTTGRVRLARAIASQLRLKIGDINKVINVKAGSYDDPSGVIVVTREAIPLINFLTSGQRTTIKRKGAGAKLGRVKVATRKTAQGGFKTAENLGRAFVATGRPSGKINIFEREKKTTPRYPLRTMFGPTPLGVLLNALGEGGQKLIDDVTDDLGDVLRTNMLAQMDRFTK